MTHLKKRLRVSTAVGLAALGTFIGAHSASAQQQSAQGGLEEIVVTAQRRSENLQTVPIAITAMTSTELERRQITRTIDLITFIPNLEGHNNTGLGGANTYYLRGLGNTESIAVIDPHRSAPMSTSSMSRVRTATTLPSSTSTVSKSCGVRRARCTDATRPAARSTSI